MGFYGRLEGFEEIIAGVAPTRVLGDNYPHKHVWTIGDDLGEISMGNCSAEDIPQFWSKDLPGSINLWLK